MEMRIYLVGGAIRDRYMGLPADQVKDMDFVVVGSHHQDMLNMGFKQVGKDFPTYLNGSGAQFSLARRSRTGDVSDFGPEVTLEEDLGKRDLTMNAMAGAVTDNGQYIDPYGGRIDIELKILRHVSDVSFIEDPIRVLRVARFAARYPDFRVAPETEQIMQSLVQDHKLDNLSPERVWQELSRGLMEKKPSRMLQVLRQCGALKVILPELDALYGVPQPEKHHPEIDTGIHTEQAIDYAALEHFPLPTRFAALLHDLGKALTPSETWPAHHGHEALGVLGVEAICDRLKVPTDVKLVAVMVAREHGNIHGAMVMKTTSIVKVLRRCDAFRNPDRFKMVLQAALCDARGRHSATVSMLDTPYPQATRFANALWAAQQVKGGPIAEQYLGRPEFIQVALHAARARAVRAFENYRVDL